MNKSKFLKFLTRFRQKRILVVGDLILDHYILGQVSRISPEAPVPVVVQEKTFYTPGGASSVGHNLSSLGAGVIQIGKIGNDLEGLVLKKELRKKRIDTRSIIIDPDCPTITKTRVIAQHQQIVRIDREKTEDHLSVKLWDTIRNSISKKIHDVDAVIISDYGKGLVTSELVQFLGHLAIKHKKVITVDPKVGHFQFYKNVTAITPNLKETENAIRHIKITSEFAGDFSVNDDNLKTDRDIERAGRELLKFLNLKCLLITLGERGMKLFEHQKETVSISTQAKEVYDVTGAGDTVISVFTLGLVSGATYEEAAKLANLAAGVVVGKLGAAAITLPELKQAILEQ